MPEEKKEKDDVTNQEECGLCHFWKPFRDGKGECYCKAPLPYIHDSEQETLHKVTRWPLTKEHECCGEYQKAKKYRRAGAPLR